MAGHPESEAHVGDNGPVQSPFAHVAGVAPRSKPSKGLLLFGIIGGVVILVAAVIGGILLGRQSSDSFRTVKDFPIEEYFTDYHSVAGGTFKTDASVAADLGWKQESGRLMVFSTSDNARRLAILLPPALSDIHFSKGQRYRLVFKVMEGGLLYANSCSKL